MLGFVLQRLLLAVAIILLALIALLVMIHAVPGDPANVLLGPRATPEMKAALRAEMGLDRPIPVQLATFVANVFRGDLGTDVFSRRPVADIVLDQLPYTLAVIGAGFAGAAALGIPLGVLSATRPGGVLDALVGVFSVAFIAVPAFIVAIYAVLVFSVGLRWLPSVGAGEPGDIGSQLRHLVLPAFAVGLGWIGYFARLVRASMLEVLAEPHVHAARAHGLTERRILVAYALPIAILPTITVIGVGLGYMISAAVLTEIVFARPGIGKLLYDSVTTRNYPVVLGSVLVTTVLFVLSTTAADILNGLLDPRIRERL